MGVLTENSVYGVIRASSPTFRNPRDKIAFAVHACFIASGFHLHSTGSYEHVNTVASSSSTEEVGIGNWNQGTNHYGFVYSDPEQSTKKIVVTILTLGDELMVSVWRDGDSVLTDFDIKVTDYVLDTEENDRYFKNFGKLVEDIEKVLVNKYDGSSAAATTATTSGKKDQSRYEVQRNMLNNQTVNAEGMTDAQQIINKRGETVVENDKSGESEPETDIGPEPETEPDQSRDEDQRDSLNNHTGIPEGTTEAEHATPEENSEREHTDTESDPEPEPDFKAKEKVLVYFHQMLYPAKICHVNVYVDSPVHVLWRYYISYNDWGEEWEEWVSHMRILKSNNTRTMRAQEAAVRRLPAGTKTKTWRPPERDKKNKVNGRWVDDIYQEKEKIDRELGTPLPELLFVRMIEDRDLCVHGGLVVVLPHPCPMDTIVERFILHARDLGRPRLREKIVYKWITAFNEKSSDYLYEPEQRAFRSIRSPDITHRLPSQLYGVEHLVRLLVSLPKSLLKYRGSTKDDMIELRADFLSFIEAHEIEFYHVLA